MLILVIVVITICVFFLLYFIAFSLIFIPISSLLFENYCHKVFVAILLATLAKFAAIWQFLYLRASLINLTLTWSVFAA